MTEQQDWWEEQKLSIIVYGRKRDARYREFTKLLSQAKAQRDAEILEWQKMTGCKTPKEAQHYLQVIKKEIEIIKKLQKRWVGR